MVSKISQNIKTKPTKNVQLKPPKKEESKLPKYAHKWQCTNCKDTITGQMCQLKHCENCNFVGTFVRID